MLRLCARGLSPPRKLPLWLLLSDLAAETRFFSPSPEPPTRGSASAPCWETSVPQTLCAPIPPNPGYATGVQVFIEAMAKVQTACKGTARRHVVQRDRATLQRADKPCDATWCRETAQRHVVQKDRATLCGAA